MTDIAKRIENHLAEIDEALTDRRNRIGADQTYAALLQAKSTALGALAGLPAEVNCKISVGKPKLEAFLDGK